MVASTPLLRHIYPKLSEHLAPKWKRGRLRTCIEISLEKLIELHRNKKEEEVGEDTGGLVRQTVHGGINEFCDIICCILEENRILVGRRRAGGRHLAYTDPPLQRKQRDVR